MKGLLVGGMIGGTAALLLAPRSGKETRKIMTDEIDDTLQLFYDVKEDSEHVVENATRVQDIVDNLVPQVLEEAEKSIKAFQFKSKYRIDDIKNQLTKIEKEVNEFTESMK